MNTAMPRPRSAASPPRSVNSSTRSISTSPESARPRTAGASMPGCHWSRSRASGPASRCANDRITPSTWVTESSSGWPSSRTAWWSADDSGRRSPWSGRASSLPVPQPRRTAAERSALSSTVLPTPRSPVSTTLRSGRPLATRSRTTSKARSCGVAAGELGRPLTGAGRVRVADRVHARTVSGCLAWAVDSAAAWSRQARPTGRGSTDRNGTTDERAPRPAHGTGSPSGSSPGSDGSSSPLPRMTGVRRVAGARVNNPDSCRDGLDHRLVQLN